MSEQAATAVETTPQPTEAAAPPPEALDPSNIVGDDLWPGGLRDETSGDPFADAIDAAVAEASQTPEVAPEESAAESAEADDGEEIDYRAEYEKLQKRFEDTQKWGQSQSQDRAELEKRLAALESGVAEKASSEDRNKLLKEIRDVDPETFRDEDKLKDWVISTAEKLSQANSSGLQQKLDAAETQLQQAQKGFIYLNLFDQAGEHKDAVKQTVAYMVNHYRQTKNGNLYDDYSPEEVVAGAWQLLQQQAAQNTNTPSQPTEAPQQLQQTEATPPSPQQATAAQPPQPAQTAMSFTPETPSVGLASNAVTTATQGGYTDINGAVLAAVAEAEGR